MRIANPTARRGEEIASKYLQKHGYKVTERNFRKGYGEIDIIAVHPSTGSGSNGILVFVEVKTRTSQEFGSPLEAIAPWKLRALTKTAQFYKMTHQNLPEQMRIDAISVMLSPGGEEERVEHIENISGF